MRHFLVLLLLLGLRCEVGAQVERHPVEHTYNPDTNIRYILDMLRKWDDRYRASREEAVGPCDTILSYADPYGSCWELLA